MNLKTVENWRGSLYEYLQVGDLVDEGIYNHFINVMPPATLRSTLVQIGEPYCHIDGKPTFATLEKNKSGWMYMGNCFRGETVCKS